MQDGNGKFYKTPLYLIKGLLSVEVAFSNLQYV